MNVNIVRCVATGSCAWLLFGCRKALRSNFMKESLKVYVGEMCPICKASGLELELEVEVLSE